MPILSGSTLNTLFLLVCIQNYKLQSSLLIILDVLPGLLAELSFFVKLAILSFHSNLAYCHWSADKQSKSDFK